MDKNQPRIQSEIPTQLHWLQLSRNLTNSLNNQSVYGGTDPIVNGRARQYILAPSLQNPPIRSVLFTHHKIGLSVEQLTDPFVAPLVASVSAITDPLNDNVFPSGDIYNLLVLSPVSDANDTLKPNVLLAQLLGVVNICHYPVISPTVESLLQPN
ncbi:MAG: hypothetical protein EZS28_017266 [Streblomastix strix]|uniref:Uncharacterized protein n=1 Tax=Streblomastix strix TaxID=222440 RepID=A0A5J4VX85_9EUKA|nr:MAG: hypothetical protein EZS28_017266 [Streblomastix strix]